jgi:hypothetical protein
VLAVAVETPDGSSSFNSMAPEMRAATMAPTTAPMTAAPNLLLRWSGTGW